MAGPVEVIRKFCLKCSENYAEIRSCGGDQALPTPCEFYPFRMKRGRPKLRLLRKFCLSCMGGSPKAVSECPTAKCPIYPYRMGHRPKAVVEYVFSPEIKTRSTG